MRPLITFALATLLSATSAFAQQGPATLGGNTANPTATTSTVSRPGIVVTSTDGFIATNPTAATVGVPVQMSPRSKWCGAAYNSVSTLSETDCMFAEVLPATVAGTTTQLWKLGSIINGGAATYPMTLDNTGLAGFGSSVNALNGSFVSGATGGFSINTRGFILNTANGLWGLNNSAATIGNVLKTDALPTVSACGAGSPAVTAGSTPLSGSVTIGTTAVATCTITFNGTAFPSVPHCSGAVETTTAANARAMGYSASVTVLTIVPSAAWVDSSVVNWTCISPR